MLHTVNKSPFEKDSLATCLRLALNGSDILLIEDAVYAALVGTSIDASVRAAGERCRIYALQEDLAARGIDTAELVPGIEVVDYGGFVDLVAGNDSVQCWL